MHLWVEKLEKLGKRMSLKLDATGKLRNKTKTESLGFYLERKGRIKNRIEVFIKKKKANCIFCHSTILDRHKSGLMITLVIMYLYDVKFLKVMKSREKF